MVRMNIGLFYVALEAIHDTMPAQVEGGVVRAGQRERSRRARQAHHRARPGGAMARLLTRVRNGGPRQHCRVPFWR
jgi:hypothetical protein